MARSAAAVFVAIICCLAVLLPQASAQNNADERSGNKVKTCAGGQGQTVSAAMLGFGRDGITPRMRITSKSKTTCGPILPLFVSGNGGITTQQDATASTISAAAITNTDYTNQLEERVNQLVNEFRAQNGLGPLTRDARIDLQSRGHSNNMADGTVAFGHAGFPQRVQNSGINWRSAGENVAYNYGYSDPAQTAVTGWINSPGHRANMLGNFNLSGIGAAIAANGAVYFTQVFILSA
eukprot:jgi/Chrzof1/10345/Cz04g38190.t1